MLAYCCPTGYRCDGLAQSAKRKYTSAMTRTNSQSINITVDDNVVGLIDGEFIPLDYPDMPMRADPAIGMDSHGTIYAVMHRRIFVSDDDGRSWSGLTVDIEHLDDLVQVDVALLTING